MNVSGLRILIRIQKNEIVMDQFGNHKTTWTDYFSCWASVGTGAGAEKTGVVVNPEESTDFTVRYSLETAAVTSTKYRILTQGKIYNITYVNPMGYKHNCLKFNCSLQKEKL